MNHSNYSTTAKTRKRKSAPTPQKTTTTTKPPPALDRCGVRLTPCQLLDVKWAPEATATATATTPTAAAAAEPPALPTFLERPPALIEAREGDNIRLPCVVDIHYTKFIWSRMVFKPPQKKPAPMPFLMSSMKDEDMKPISETNYWFTGNRSANDYSMEIRNLRLNDTGEYECRMMDVDVYSEYQELRPRFLVRTNITVLPRPTPSTSQLADPLDTTKPNASDLGQLELIAATSSKNGHLVPSSQLQARRDISSSLTHLTTNTALLPATRRALDHNQQGPAAIGLVVATPYLLLALALLLLMVNVYLIYSLVRLKRR